MVLHVLLVLREIHLIHATYTCTQADNSTISCTILIWDLLTPLLLPFCMQSFKLQSSLLSPLTWHSCSSEWTTTNTSAPSTRSILQSKVWPPVDLCESWYCMFLLCTAKLMLITGCCYLQHITVLSPSCYACQVNRQLIIFKSNQQFLQSRNMFQITLNSVFKHKQNKAKCIHKPYATKIV